MIEMLSARQLVVLELLARGFSVKGAAVELGYSVWTLYPELVAIRRILRVETDAGAVVEGLRLGLIQMPGQSEMVGWVV